MNDEILHSIECECKECLDKWKKMECNIPIKMHREMMDEEYKLPILDLEYAEVLTRGLFYPANTFAKQLANLIKRKAFTEGDIKKLKNLGFPINIGSRKIEIPKGFI